MISTWSFPLSSDRLSSTHSKALPVRFCKGKSSSLQSQFQVQLEAQNFRRPPSHVDLELLEQAANPNGTQSSPGSTTSVDLKITGNSLHQSIYSKTEYPKSQWSIETGHKPVVIRKWYLFAKIVVVNPLEKQYPPRSMAGSHKSCPTVVRQVFRQMPHNSSIRVRAAYVHVPCFSHLHLSTYIYRRLHSTRTFTGENHF